MKGDFTRDTFNPAKHFSRVLSQQGRVQLDADLNEQVAILLHYMQTLAADLIGPHGGPHDIFKTGEDGTQLVQRNCGFEIASVSSGDKMTDLTIGAGRYYVDGILCEHDPQFDDQNQEILAYYYNQPGYPLNKDKDPFPKLPFLVYLDVWERHLTALD